MQKKCVAFNDCENSLPAYQDLHIWRILKLFLKPIADNTEMFIILNNLLKNINFPTSYEVFMY